jgi:hypothetical protein
MTNRRTLLRAHSHWRPGSAAVTGPRRQPPPSTRKRFFGRRLAAAIAGVIAVVVIAVGLLMTRGPAPSSLPRTPVAWVDAFSAAVARDPGRVCSQLVSGSFRAALERDVHRSCSGYYSEVRVLSVRILRVLQSGATAALEVRYWPRGGYTTFVLDRQDGGWRAVAIVPGGPLPVA